MSAVKAMIAGFMMAVLGTVGARAAVPRVVASIKPVESLVAGVMEGIGTPDLLIKGGASPHAYSLRPSDAEALVHADLIFWIGPSFETFLERPLMALGGKARVVTLIEMPGLKLLPARKGGLWEAGAADEVTSTIDGHIWLDADNAKTMVAEIARRLEASDPANSNRYAANAAALETKLDVLDADLRAKLAPAAGKPFIVFHDAYQYFEVRYGLNALGSLTVSPERAPGARRIAEIRQKIAALGALCVFAEPQFEPKLIRTLVADSGAKTGILDPEGSTLASGPTLHFNLLRELADNLLRCVTTP